MDIVEKLILDDSQFSSAAKKTVETLEKMKDANNAVAESALKNAENQKKSADQTAKDAKKLSDIQQKAIEDVAKAEKESIMIQEQHTRQVKELAGAILSSGDTAKRFSDLLNKLNDLSLSGATVEVVDLEKELTDLFSTVKLTDEQIEFLVNNIKDIATEIANIDVKQLDELANNSEEVTTKFTSAKRELRELTNLITSGQLTGDELAKATQRAAQLTDEIGDTRDEIKQLSSDTRKLDLLVEGATAVGAGFQLAEGAMALMGDESKEMQQTLIKLNAVMAISNGLQQVGEVLTKKGGIAALFAANAKKVWTIAIGQSTGAMKLLRVALASTGIGLLIVGLGLLIANWDKFKKAIDDNSKTMFEFAKRVTILMPPLNLLIRGIEYLYNNFSRLDNIASGVIDGVVAGLGAIGDVVAKIFDGKFTEAYEAAKQVGSKVGAAFNQGVAEADKKDADNQQAKVIDNLVKSQKKRLEVLQAGGKDTFKLQKNILENELKSLKLTNAEKEKIEEKQQELAVLNAERRKELNDKAAAAEKAKNEALKQALKDFKSIQEQVFEAQKNVNLFTEEELFNFSKTKQIQQLQLLITNLKELGKTGIEVSDEIAKLEEVIKKVSETKFIAKLEFLDTPENDEFNINNLIEQSKIRRLIEQQEIEDSILSQEAKEELKTEIALRGELDRLNILKEYGTKGTAQYEEILLQISEVSNKLNPEIEVPVIVTPEINNFEDLLNQTLEKVFGADGSGKAKEFIKGASLALGEFNDLLAESQQLQIEAIDKQLEKLSEKREELEQALDYELELREQGLANNVGDKQREVDAILAEEARLEKEKESIKVAAQKRQFAIDTISQTTDLITSAIGIFKGFKDIPFGLGVPLAIATVASMFAFFAKVKVDAYKATKLSTGADRISDHFGFGERYGSTDLEGRGKGYRLVNEATGSPTNVIISGREMLLPEKYSLEHELFFQKMKTGAYNGMDLNAAMGFYLNFKDRNSEGGGSLTVQQKITPQKPNRQWIPFVTKDGKSGAVLKTITEKELDGSIIHFDL